MGLGLPFYRPNVERMSTEKGLGMYLAGGGAKMATSFVSPRRPARWQGAAVWRACEEPAERRSGGGLLQGDAWGGAGLLTGGETDGGGQNQWRAAAGRRPCFPAERGRRTVETRVVL